MAVVAFTNADERLAVLNIGTGAEVGRLEHRSVGVMSIAVSADGSTAAVIGADEEARVFTVSTGKQTFGHPVDLPRVPGMGPVMPWARHPVAVFGPDGGKVYLTGIRGGAARFAPGGKSPEVVYPLGDGDRATCLAVSADAAEVAVGTYGSDVVTFAAGTGTLLRRVSFGDRVRAVAFSTNGRVLAAALDGGGIVLVPLT